MKPPGPDVLTGADEIARDLVAYCASVAVALQHEGVGDGVWVCPGTAGKIGEIDSHELTFVAVGEDGMMLARVALGADDLAHQLAEMLRDLGILPPAGTVKH